MTTDAGRIRLLRRPSLRVEVAAALNLVGTLLAYLSPALLFPVPFALGYGDPVWPYLGAAVLTAAAGLALRGVTRGRDVVGAREGFLVVSLLWLLAPAAGALPYLLAGTPGLSTPLDAYFEAMSGFTTTGATVLTDVEALSRSMAMWRQFSQWIGGLGIIVLALAVLPRLRVGGRQLFESELPGPEIEPLVTSIRETARRLWALYIALTAVLVLALWFFALSGIDDAMSLYDALAHAFTTMPTGGFSTRARSLEEFGAATQWTVTLFMLVAGVNFALLFAAFVQRRPRRLVRDEEFRLYVVLLGLATALLCVELAAEGIERGEAAIRHAAFVSVSVMTTTGYASTDYNEWTVLATVMLVALMFFGGQAGSTSGSVKVVRHLLIGRILRRELDQTVHPELVQPLRLNRAVVDERALRAVIAFVLLYVGIFALGALALLVDAGASGRDLTVFEGVAASASMLGNVGPAFGFAGPMGSFDGFGDPSKAVLTVLMWVGRLEIIPVAVLLTRAYWRD